MNLKFLPLLASLFIITIILSSCLHGDDNEYTYSSDASITAFSINDIETSYTKKIDGKDSTVTVTVTGNDYPFAIDQLSHLIYNVDSLPYGTDVSKVSVSISADTDYILYVKADQDTVWTSSDSINFEKPVVFKVVAYDMSYGTPYKVSINVHQVDPNIMSWQEIVSTFDGEQIKRQKAVCFNDRIMVFAEKDEQVEITSTAISDGRTWTDLQPLNIPEKADYSSVIVWNNKLYILAQGKLYDSEDGEVWEMVSGVPTLSQLIAGYVTDYYQLFVGINENGDMFVESNDGISWNETTAVPTDFPTEDISFASYSLKSNEKLSRLLLIGKNKTEENYKVSWSRLSNESTWGDNIPADSEKACPDLENMGLIYYNDSIYAFGGSGVLNDTELSAFSNFYISKDQGINWEALTQDVLFPDEFSDCYTTANGNYSFTVDSNHYLWIMWSNMKNVWKGRINKLGFGE